jgi:hypothetical protein
VDVWIWGLVALIGVLLATLVLGLCAAAARADRVLAPIGERPNGRVRYPLRDQAVGEADDHSEANAP